MKRRRIVHERDGAFTASRTDCPGNGGRSAAQELMLALLFIVLSFLSPVCGAERQPVLSHVALPHAYYWRELYLPQLTTGPSSVAFMPDGETLVYSMAGSLWMQRIGEPGARELTHGPGYDFQPDVARDGSHLLFARHQGDAIEVIELDLASGRETPLTRDGRVAVEPRYAPDGNRVAFVSTRESGRFGLWLASREPGAGFSLRRLVEEQGTTLNRYYYAAQDHVINPTWSPDGGTLYFVSNRGLAWGTGDIWAIELAHPEQWRQVLREETSWSARPDVAPDGKRILYSSYHGRDWQQLWLTTTLGESPLPLTFGDFDRRNARWSPDGTRVAYIDNAGGNTTLWVQELVGGERQLIRAERREYRQPMQRLRLRVLDAAGKPLPARISVLGADGRHVAPREAWMRADDGFDPKYQGHETHYFHCNDECTVELPRGSARVTVWSGMRRRIEERQLHIGSGESTLEIRPAAIDLPPRFGDWISLDQHVHMNYGGHYRNDFDTLGAEARAEDLDVLYNLVVNKEQRVPGVAGFRSGARNRHGVTIYTSQEFHTSYWGHLGLLHLDDHLLLPDFSAYRHTALASPWPHDGVVADLAHRQGALVGHVHPFDWPIRPGSEQKLSNSLPAEVANGKLDYMEVVSFADHRSTAEVWHRLLNLGYRLPAGAGTDAMANYASLRGPVGLNRVFLNQGGRDPDALREGIRAGNSFVTNGPLLGLEVDGTRPGGTVSVGTAGSVHVRVALRSAVPVARAELVANGAVLRSLPLGDGRALDWEGEVPVDASGWLLLRADGPSQPLLFDIYPYASTNPVWLQARAPAPSASGDAAYFVAWMERVIADAAARQDYNSPAEKQATIDYLEQAQQSFQERR